MDSSAPRLRFLGTVAVTRAGQPVALPKSQKTLGLLAYLAVTQRPQLRERLSHMFWDVTDDPRGALRWSLSKLRALDDEGKRRICADRKSVSFELQGAQVDALEVRAAAAGGLEGLPADRLRELVGMFRGGFLDDLELPGFDEFQAWRVAEREQLRQLHTRLLVELIARLREDDAEAALGPARELVRLRPGDESARVDLVRLLAATGRREEAEEHYNLGRSQLDSAGASDNRLRQAWRDVASAPVAGSGNAPARPVDAHQEVRFCRGAGGVRIAYATLGQGPPLVKTANWLTHLEFDWKSPLWRHLARELSRELRLIRYDQRGNGLSDWQVEDFSLDAFVGDLAAVVDALGLERFPLLGVSQGCRVAVAYAAAHPDRVSHLILYGGAARGWQHRSGSARETRSGLQALIRQGWGGDLPVFRQVFAKLFMPDASPEQARWFDELQRVSTSAENATRLTEAIAEVNVTELLGQVRVPTLVMHATRDAMVPFEEGRLLAAGIADARFVALESNNHLLLDDEPAFARFLWEIRDFLAVAQTAS